MEDFPSIDMSYTEICNYFPQLTEVLAEYSWIYAAKNTDTFVSDVLERIPEPWKESLKILTLEELSQVPFGFIKEDWPLSLKKIINESCKFSNIRFPDIKSLSYSIDKIEVPEYVKKSTPLKKQSEIQCVTALISSLCTKFPNMVILDVGSGLGYLDQVLHHNLGIACIGLDHGPNRTSSAKLRLEKAVCNKMIFHETVLVENSENCLLSLTSLVNKVKTNNVKCYCSKTKVRDETAEESSVIMIGLHCCGKLPHDMMKLCCKMPDVKALVCLGCCYHLMDKKEFPISKAARLAIERTQVLYPDWSPCPSGFRLGSQCTRKFWASQTEELHQLQERHLLYRGVLEYYMQKENITTWRKPKRRVRASCLTDFKTYCLNMLQNMSWDESEMQERIENLLNLFCNKEHHLCNIRILMVLQLLLQPLWEIFLTFDRIAFLQENSIDTKAFILWDDVDSPRDIAICGFKT